MKDKKNYSEEILIPAGIEVKVENSMINVKGSKGETSKQITTPLIKIDVKEGKIKLSSDKSSKKIKRFIGTFKAHMKNMIKGVETPFVYKLKICSGHFPMNISLNKNELIIKNFIGEKHPRTLKLKEGASVKLDGDIIIVESIDKEIGGQVAADIENITKRPNFDSRIFQDGIYITEKAGKELK